MIGVLSKSREEIDISDIQDLIDSEVPEGEQIEFKETLPAKGQSVDPWMNGKNEIGDRAKNEILKEAVAFANAHGGALLLGIKESESKPPVAAEISPIPRCAELAERFKLVFRDCVEPQLPVLDIFAVPTDGESGVVIIRVGRSRNAPHRIMKTLVCPVRRADRCEEMSMREIQDMTLNVSRGLERLDRRLSERSEFFEEEFKRLETPENAFGVRMTAAPVGDEIWFDRVLYQGRIIEEFSMPWLTVKRQSSNREQKLNFHSHDWVPKYWQPMLRAARANLDSTFPGKPYNGHWELHFDGLIEMDLFLTGSSADSISYNGPVLFNWLIAIFAKLAVWADHIRRQADAPTAEYVLEVEICVRGNEISFFMENGMNNGSGKLLPGSLVKFPIYSLGDRDEILELIELFERDFWNNLAKDIGTNENTLYIEDWPR